MYDLYKDVVINTAAAYPVTILDETGATVADVSNAGAGSLVDNVDFTMNIKGFGTFRAGDLCYLKGQRGIASQKQISTLTFGTGAQWTYVAPSVPTTVYFKITVNSNNYSAEYTRYEMTFAEEIVFAIKVLPTDTDTAVRTKLANAVIDRQTRFPEDTGYTAVVNGTTSIVFTAVDEHVTLTFSVEDEFDTNYSAIITAFAPAVTQRRFEGVQDSTFIKENVRLLTHVSTHPYGIRTDELAIDGKLYHSFTFEVQNLRPELAGNSVAGQVNASKARFTIYANQDLAGATNPFGQIGYFLQGAAVLTSVTPAYYLATLTNSANPVEAQAITTGAIAAMVA